MGHSSEELDWEKMLGYLGGNCELLEEMIAVFLQESARMLAEIEGAVACGDCKKLEMVAHSLRGSALIFGHQETCELLGRLEDMASQGDLTHAGAALSSLGKALERLQHALHHPIGYPE